MWLRAVVDTAGADTADGRPEVAAIVAVASLRALRANPDGTGCYPAAATIAGKGGLKRGTVGRVDRWLVGAGLMVKVRTLRDNITEYRLVVPPEVQPEAGPVVPPEVQPEAVGCAPGCTPGCTPREHNLLPPNEMRREEERRGGADAPPPPPTAASMRAVRDACQLTRQPLDLDIVAAAVDRFRATHDWSEAAIVAWIADRAQAATTNPSGYVVGALQRPDPKLPIKVRALLAYDSAGRIEDDLEQLLGDQYFTWSDDHGLYGALRDVGDVEDELLKGDDRRAADLMRRILDATTQTETKLRSTVNVTRADDEW